MLIRHAREDDWADVVRIEPVSYTHLPKKARLNLRNNQRRTQTVVGFIRENIDVYKRQATCCGLSKN